MTLHLFLPSFSPFFDDHSSCTSVVPRIVNKVSYVMRIFVVQSETLKYRVVLEYYIVVQTSTGVVLCSTE